MTGTPLVSIRCLVYNHEPYLRQCLDGFVMQRTSFPFEAIVHDDCSTDGSAAIIREYAEKYPDIIKPIYETENQFSKHDGSLARAMDAAMHPGSKYVALCEGDDYWTDPDKLQKQVDIMEKDPEVGLVHTSARAFIHKTGTFLDEPWGRPIESFEDELLDNKPVTLTACYRKDLFLKYRSFRENAPNDWKLGDYPLWMFLSYYSKTSFIGQPTGVYRLLNYSASHNPDPKKMMEFELSVFSIQEYFAKQFHYEHLLKKLATNFVMKIQNMAINRNSALINYGIHRLYHEYGLFNSGRLFLRHYMLVNSWSRNCFVRCRKMRQRLSHF